MASKTVHAAAIGTLALLAVVPGVTVAQPSAWHTHFNMGIAAYGTGVAGADPGAWLSLQCTPDRRVLLYTEIDGKAPPAESALTLKTSSRRGAQMHVFKTGTDGTVTFTPASARLLRTLWADLRRNDIVVVTYPDGRNAVHSLDGAARTLGARACL